MKPQPERRRDDDDGPSGTFYSSLPDAKPGTLATSIQNTDQGQMRSGGCLSNTTMGAATDDHDNDSIPELEDYDLDNDDRGQHGIIANRASLAAMFTPVLGRMMYLSSQQIDTVNT
jgi:hypothetical protein